MGGLRFCARCCCFGGLDPVGSDHSDFVLYCPNSDGKPGAPNLSDSIGSRVERNFILCKKRKSMKKAAPSKAVINRILISVKVMGSTGPIQLFVKEDELVSSVIDTVLKLYAHQGRLPALGSDHNEFCFYCFSSEVYPGIMSSSETIGSWGARDFLLCKKTQSRKEEEAAALHRKGSGSWKYSILRGAH